MHRRSLATCAAALLCATPAAAQAPPGPRQAPPDFTWGPRTSGQVGSLHRVAAVSEAVLDVYRLALVELVVATRRVREVGMAPGGGPGAAVPSAVGEVYQRLTRALQNRVPEEAMPAISRAYHAEVLDGLSALAAADQVGQVVQPTRVLLFAMERVCDAAHAVVDLFSRERPVDARVIDAEGVYDELGDALDEFAAAEQEIRVRRTQQAGQDEMASAFRRTEVALGHVLDVWAAARRVGLEVADLEGGGQPVVDVQVTPRIATATLELITRQVETRLHELEEVLAPMETPPRARFLGLRADLVEGDKGAAEAFVQWPYDEREMSGVALVRIYRVDDRERTAERLRSLYRCRGLGEAEVAAQVAAALETLGPAAVVAGQVAAGVAAFSEPLKAVPVTPPIYRVVAVGPFGAESKPAEVVADYVPRLLQGPLGVRAVLRTPRPSAPEFYEDAGAVDVSWRPSESDALTPGARELAQAKGLPTVQRYVVERLSGKLTQVVDTAASGQGSLIDRPPLALLRAGVRYRVHAVDAAGNASGESAGCTESEVLQDDLGPKLRLAAAGVASLVHPTAFEAEAAARWQDDAALAAAKQAFGARPSREVEALRLAWWQSRPEAQRLDWLRRLPELFGRERDAWVRGFDGALSERDLPWAQAALFVAEQKEQGEDLGREIGRWWSLLDEASKEQILSTWRARLDPLHRDWVTSQTKTSTEHQRHAEYPGRLLGWWRSRDLLEQRRVALWWSELERGARDRALQKWFADLPELVKVGVRWTTWEQRSAAEQQRLLEGPPAVLPPPLWRDLLAWLAWHELPPDEEVRAVRREVGTLAAGLAGIKFRLRPYDVALSFHLVAVLAASVVGLAALFVLGRALLRRRR